MPVANAMLVFSLLAGIFSSFLICFTIYFEKDKKRSRSLLIWGVLFLAASFGAAEYALWSEGYNLFEMVLGFNFPLVAFFTMFFSFLVWLFESRGERKIWIVFLIALIAMSIIAVNCMNCI